MNFISNSAQWAKHVFQHANLGDSRRVNRLIKLSATLAAHSGKSVPQANQSAADIEAAYRFIRNEAIHADAIAEAGFLATKQDALTFDTLLALEDTSSLSFSHKGVRDELGHTTSHHSSRGFQAHSVLLYAPLQMQVVGLIEQQLWTRDIATKGKRKDATKRPYIEKESFKWQRASQNMAQRLGSHMSQVVSVCDRESDLIEYLQYKLTHQQRFVVRSMISRHIEEAEGKLHLYGKSLQSAGERQVEVVQKGGRKGRVATCEVRFSPITLKMPSNKEGGSTPLFYVSCIEKDNPDGLCWHLLTSEHITTQKQALTILEWYEKRWLIEDFHKSWKSGGTQVEDLRLQSKGNLERMIVILAFIAVRIQQLRHLGQQQEVAEQQSCETLLGNKAWKLLWLKVEKSKPPKHAPTVRWAYLSLGKLAGWHDSKRTGIVGWERLWEGWFKLQTILEGYELAMSLEHEM
ncbi:IS4 family transposase [Vibrio mimicus]|uniref:IS4 family transposase n=1 Tax=Vibrio mimicus TaxID=674 RepID=UPI0001BACB00|nr:IS4 family transposase [Vibrio mimicus]EEY43522.1 transposase Tn5 dimerization protein [Vibrio mimicus VM223]EEY43849.1 transposase Tn5 dimerization protein [Vibrio mimicus VM223]EEY44268.1 transposase Tn5 dimerization protein [Vibrio mimicus VM223]